MTIATVDIGNVRVTALLDGVADLPDLPIVDAFPGAPPERLLALRDRWPGVYGNGDAWRLHARAWLVRHPGGELLVDTGLGSTVCMTWYPEPGRLLDALAEAGTSPEHIDTVVITHVHDDHIGGTVTTEGRPVFGDARHVIQRADLEAARTAGTGDDADEEGVAIWETLLAPLDAAGLFQIVEGDTTLTDALELHHAPGHTPGHQVLTIVSGGSRMVISGDTWNHPAQLAYPDWASGPDGDPDGAAATRRSMLAAVSSYPGTVVAPTHFAEPFGRVVDGPDGVPLWEAIG